METILATAFGRQVEVLKGENDIIVNSVKDYLSYISESGFTPLTVLMPLLGACLLKPPDPNYAFITRLPFMLST